MANVHMDVQSDLRLRIYGCGGNVTLNGDDRTTIEVQGSEPLELYLRQDGNTITINGYPNDLAIVLPHTATVELNGVGGDVQIAEVVQIELESIGGDVEIGQGGTASNQIVKIGHLGGDLSIERAAQLSARVVGGNAEIGQVDRLESLGHIGGDLELTLGDHLAGELRTIVGGDMELRLPREANLRLVATLGGDFSAAGEEWKLRRGSGRHQLVFGDGRATLHLMIDGDLRVSGGAAPQQATGFAGYHGEGSPDWQDIRGTMEGFGEDMRGFARELEEMGRTLARDLSNLGRDIAREVRIAGRETIRDAARNYKAGRGYGSGRGRGPQGDLGFDAEQIERIKREARAAAASGIARAQEAVEQALQQWQWGGARPNPPRRPAAPPTPERPPQPPYTGQTVRIEREEAGSVQSAPSQPVDRDAERLAILRMVHEGRLSPDEAEMLLRGLDNQG